MIWKLKLKMGKARKGRIGIFFSFVIQLSIFNFLVELKSYILWIPFNLCGFEFNHYAVVTGANKGIGLEIVKQLVSTVIKLVRITWKWCAISPWNSRIKWWKQNTLDLGLLMLFFFLRYLNILVLLILSFFFSNAWIDILV